MAEQTAINCQPEEVFHYFEEISKIPRGSGNEKAISDYLVSFAKALDLDVAQDEALNVVIKKPGTAGYEDSPALAVQGHMDMVCEKEAGSPHDFLKDPVRPRVEGDMMYATGTTLGADNGIAVAMGMAVLASDDMPHPPIELLVTTNEETGMDGAWALDPGLVSARTLINIDSEEEGILTVSCAGGCTARINIPVSREAPDPDLAVLAITIGGLKGGHSGVEIHTGRANANKVLARFLRGLEPHMKITLFSIDGGSKHNAIAREACAVIGIKKQDEAALRENAESLEKVLRDEYKVSDPDICLRVGEPGPGQGQAPGGAMTKASAEAVLRFLFLIPNGVQSMSMDIKGLVESSLNLGIVRTTEESVEIVSTLRSSVASIMENIFNTVETIAGISNGVVTKEGEYPEWRYNPNSRVRDILVGLHEKLFGEAPKIDAIHAGLECAVFDKRFGGAMDMISFGPNIMGAHTTQEHLDIPSTQRMWSYLKEALKALR